MSQQSGRRYRDIILAPGGTRDADDVLRDFLGREPNQEAFLRTQIGFYDAPSDVPPSSFSPRTQKEIAEFAVLDA